MSAPSVPIIEIHPWAFPNSLRFAWGPPDTGPVSSYNLICSSISFNRSFNSSTFSVQVSSLTNNQDYTFQLRAQNADGSSPYEKFLIAKPGAPSKGAVNVRASTVNSTIANVSWSYSTNTGECRAQYFAISAIPSTTELSTLVLIAYPNQSTFQIRNLEPTQTYTFLVQAVTDAAWAYPFSYSISPPLNMNPPPAIAGLKIHLNASTYSGSGTWFDSSTNGKNATLENGVIAKNAKGNGIVLNGSTNWQFPNIATGNAWTLGVWYMNTGGFNGAACIISQLYTGGTINTSLGVATGNLVGFFFNGGFKQGNIIALTLNVWTNIQVTWDGTSMRTYINSSSIGTTTPGGVAVDSGNSYRIGRRWDTAQYVTGVIGAVKIYNRVLTQAEVTQDYTSTQALYA
jgi:hypothetical protein